MTRVSEFFMTRSVRRRSCAKESSTDGVDEESGRASRCNQSEPTPCRRSCFPAGADGTTDRSSCSSLSYPSIRCTLVAQGLGRTVQTDCRRNAMAPSGIRPIG